MSADAFARQHRNWAQWFGADWHAVRLATTARAAAAIADWELSGAEPFGGGAVGYVYRARRHTGEAVVLKVEPATTAWAPQGADRALAIWARAGLAPRVIASRDDGRTLLLERVTPGTPLGDRSPSIDVTFPVIADMARRLRTARRTTATSCVPATGGS